MTAAERSKRHRGLQSRVRQIQQPSARRHDVPFWLLAVLWAAGHAVAAEETRAPPAAVGLAGPLVELAATVHTVIGTAGRGGRPRSRGCILAALMPAFHDPNAERDQRRRRPALLVAGAMTASKRAMAVPVAWRVPVVGVRPGTDVLTSACHHACIASRSRGAVRAPTSNPIAAMRR
jgi:hypothetical protein